MAQWHGYLTLITTLTGYLRAQASSNHYSLVRPYSDPRCIWLCVFLRVESE